uniref:Uncharacterized protein n=1 Tax=Chromera velia CCMP2878 TaxID=1169474 RepID=A0A0G4HG93_9ALVE|eukprot:Cvel_6686.t1-p1 / transcript=Cvel_6686.t1 / gene=Cvel_6686 / organism=Chromera_velia_CCMP2878 / gene_product=hypothetical protein / transcript_product=hypothetical protein / location=Cvel_scaffold333:2244-7309(-) / protein_length=460 / sequence_SO=supercontig / SO=protein_coding / is_pseudo=false
MARGHGGTLGGCLGRTLHFVLSLTFVSLEFCNALFVSLRRLFCCRGRREGSAVPGSAGQGKGKAPSHFAVSFGDPEVEKLSPEELSRFGDTLLSQCRSRGARFLTIVAPTPGSTAILGRHLIKNKAAVCATGSLGDGSRGDEKTGEGEDDEGDASVEREEICPSVRFLCAEEGKRDFARVALRCAEEVRRGHLRLEDINQELVYKELEAGGSWSYASCLLVARLSASQKAWVSIKGAWNRLTLRHNPLLTAASRVLRALLFPSLSLSVTLGSVLFHLLGRNGGTAGGEKEKECGGAEKTLETREDRAEEESIQIPRQRARKAELRANFSSTEAEKQARRRAAPPACPPACPPAEERTGGTQKTKGEAKKARDRNGERNVVGLKGARNPGETDKPSSSVSLFSRFLYGWTGGSNSGVVGPLPSVSPILLAASEIYEEWSVSPDSVLRCFERYSRTEQRHGR